MKEYAKKWNTSSSLFTSLEIKAIEQNVLRLELKCGPDLNNQHYYADALSCIFRIVTGLKALDKSLNINRTKTPKSINKAFNKFNSYYNHSIDAEMSVDELIESMFGTFGIVLADLVSNKGHICYATKFCIVFLEDLNASSVQVDTLSIPESAFEF